MSLLLLSLAPAVASPLPIRFEFDEKLALEEPTDDVFGMAQEVKLGGGVTDNAVLMGEDVFVDGPVGGDVIAMASEVRIRGPVAGDLYAFAAEVVVEAGGSIGGHVHAFGGDVELKGPIGGDVTAGAGVLELQGPIGGDVDAEVGELVVSSGAVVGGDLVYTAPTEVSGLDSIVAGSVSFEEAVSDDVAVEVEEESGSFVGSVMSWAVWKSWAYGNKLLVGALLLLIGGAVAGRASRVVVDKPAASLGLGFTVYGVLVLASVLSTVTIVALPVGLVGFALLAILLYVAQLVTAQALGDLALKRFRPGAWGSPYLSLAIGLVPLVLVYSLPWVGWLAWFVATTFGLGAMWIHLRSLSAE